jgi:hypothetical protein
VLTSDENFECINACTWCHVSGIQVESQVSDTASKLGNRPFVGAAPKLHPPHRPMTISSCSLCYLYPSRVRQGFGTDVGMCRRQIQTVATAGKSPDLILSPRLRKRPDSLKSCCEVAASETPAFYLYTVIRGVLGSPVGPPRRKGTFTCQSIGKIPYLRLK